MRRLHPCEQADELILEDKDDSNSVRVSNVMLLLFV